MEYFCKKCDYKTHVKRNWNLHIKTKKHLRDNRKKEFFYCETCDYQAKCRQNLYSHKKTIRHINKIKIEKEREEFQKMKKKLEYLKMAEQIRVLEDRLENERKLREKERKREHDELKQTLIENNKVMTNTLKKAVENSGNKTTIKNTNCGNKTININVFLKEKCKDAMNLEDFVNRLTVGMDDIKYAIDNGGSEAISRLLIKNLQNLPPTDRPIHCADERRSKFYIKAKENGWEEESADPQQSALNWQLSRTQHKFCDFVNF